MRVTKDSGMAGNEESGEGGGCRFMGLAAVGFSFFHLYIIG